MAIKLSSNPTCVLSDADNLTAEQRQKLNMNLTKGIPGSNISGDKVTVINSDGEVEMKAYSAGGGGGTSYTAGDGISISNDTISAKVDGSTIGVNASGQLEAIGGGSSSGGYTTISIDPSNINAQEIYEAVATAYSNNLIPVISWRPHYGKYHYIPLTYRVENVGNDTWQYWFDGSYLTELTSVTGTLNHWMICVSNTYSSRTESYEYFVESYLTSQSNVSLSETWSEP